MLGSKIFIYFVYNKIRIAFQIFATFRLASSLLMLVSPSMSVF